MKNYLLLTGFLLGIVLSAHAQDEVVQAAQEACGCMKTLDPDKLTKRDLSLSMMGCMSRPIDGIAETLKKRNAWSDTSALAFLGMIAKEARARCPEEFARLKKKEVEIDPVLLAIKPESEIVPGFSQAVCNCLGVVKDLNECMQKVGTSNEAELNRRFPGGDPLSSMMGIMMDVMFELADHCDAAATNETIGKMKAFPAIHEGCSNLVLGEFSTASPLGDTRSKFTSNKLQEFTGGKLSSEYSIKWSACTLTTTCTTTNSSMVKKGEITIMEIKRASSEGFIAVMSFGKLKVPVTYNKVK